ncbi:MAG: CsgG/HfaB family protein [Proteobacteria bacterium]|nr:CsgG/HfaB family protein [Pseudomonadota bacterium]
MNNQFSGSIALMVCFVFLFIVDLGGGGAAGKATVAVLDFESIGSEEYLGKAVAEIMRTELVGADRFRVVERAQIKQALTEQALQVSGVIDTKSAVELGKMLGADLIIVGSVVKIGSAYTINSRMIDVKTGEAQLGRNATGNDLNLLTSLSRDLIEGLFGQGKKSLAAASTTALPPPPVPALKKTEPSGSGNESPVVSDGELESEITWDFETGDLRGWESVGEAFKYQPTYEDNPTARQRGQPSRHQGEYWIGSFESRPRPDFVAGAVQGDEPQGTLTSLPFVISNPTISFLIGGGCDVDSEHVELRVSNRSVLKTTGQCNETMQRVRWNVAHLQGKEARIQIVDRSSGGWGHINVDDFRFE